jgi:hypothetical protein
VRVTFVRSRPGLVPFTVRPPAAPPLGVRAEQRDGRVHLPGERGKRVGPLQELRVSPGPSQASHQLGVQRLERGLGNRVSIAASQRRAAARYCCKQ